LALAGCSSTDERANAIEIEKETAERDELIAAMQNHPSQQEGRGSEATGEPINVPTTVPPAPKNEHEHREEPPQDPGTE
jgi:hypothetical protein